MHAFDMSKWKPLAIGALLRSYGFGNPVISVSDDQVGYYLKPNSHYNRFGHVYQINSLGMRSDDFDLGKRPKEKVAAIFGDSVIFGYALDQKETVAAQMQKLLRQSTRDVVVDSVAVSGWGPDSIRGFYEKFGPLGGCLAIVVQSTHDMVDVIDADVPHPARNIYGAIDDAAHSVWRKGRSWYLSMDWSNEIHRRSIAKKSLYALLAALKRDYKEVVLVFHADSIETDAGAGEGQEYFASVAKEVQIAFVSTIATYRAAKQGGILPFQDQIHLSAKGAELFAREMSRRFRAQCSPEKID